MSETGRDSRRRDGARFAVLGGGLAGLCTARSLARGGASVTLVEKRTLGSGATGAAAGLLEAPWSPRSAYQRSLTASYRGYERFVRELGRESGVSIEFERLGSLHLVAAGDEDGESETVAGLRARAQSQRRDGAPVEWWDRDALRRRMQGISSRFAGGLFNREAARVHPPDLVSALSRSLQALEVRIFEGPERLRFESDGDGLWSLDTGTAGEEPGLERVRLVACAGAWTRELLEALGQESEAEVVPVRGQMLEVALGEDPPPTVLHHDDRYLIPRPDRRVWVGATVEEAGFDERVTPEGIDSLLGTAREVFPSIDVGDVRRSWCGLRPKVLRRGGAILGAAGVAVLAGHYRSGILAAPRDADRLTARLLGPAAADSPFDLEER